MQFCSLHSRDLCKRILFNPSLTCEAVNCCLYLIHKEITMQGQIWRNQILQTFLILFLCKLQHPQMPTAQLAAAPRLDRGTLSCREAGKRVVTEAVGREPAVILLLVFSCFFSSFLGFIVLVCFLRTDFSLLNSLTSLWGCFLLLFCADFGVFVLFSSVF